MEDSSRFESNSAEIASSLLDGELVLINLSTGVYYSMANAGSLIWQLIDMGFSLSETVDTVASRYGMPADQVNADVRSVLEQMLQERIFLPASGTRARGVYAPDGGALTYESPVLHVYRDMGDLLALDAPMPDMQDIPWKPKSGN
ncbi:MAG: PqqD family protein [Deltaproteobacteria bacterium]|nr:PqqD family protein [Deltaproteobacteria bacterium]